MLTRLVSLTRPLAIEGPRALGVAIYARQDGSVVSARESGEEGVACLDDAARALVLWCDLWERTKSPVARAWVDGLLAFCRWMQQADGRFLNFILDWNGALNVEGITSRADGASFWHARGARAMAKVWQTFGDARARGDYERAKAWFDVRPTGSDVRAIQVLAELDAGELADDIAKRCDDIASQRRGDVLVDSHDATVPHLWGHIQEGVLATAATALGRPDLLEIARRSADAYLVPVIARGFDLDTVQPYGAASSVFVMERLRAACGDGRYDDAAIQARAWFDGRNPAGRPVYDRVAGRVADGIDGGRLNPDSGAESNILGAQALLEEVAAWLVRHPDECSPSVPSSRSSDVSSAVS
jgi:hypothetical protein